MRYKIELQYVGTNFHGWQRQPNAITVQECLENTFAKILRNNVAITGCGRTDTGVHAEYYVAHFDSSTLIGEDFIKRVNGMLSTDISLISINPCDEAFHARFDAKKRSYKYVIDTLKNPFNNGFSWFVRFPLNVELMEQAAVKLFDYTDFTSFSKLHTDVKTNNCKILSAYFEVSDKQIVFHISADRFLRNMVRAIVGTLVEVGKGNLTIADFCEIIEKKDRCEAGQSVPASGLFLTEVKY